MSNARARTADKDDGSKSLMLFFSYGMLRGKIGMRVRAAADVNKIRVLFISSLYYY